MTSFMAIQNGCYDRDLDTYLLSYERRLFLLLSRRFLTKKNPEVETLSICNPGSASNLARFRVKL